MFEKPGQQDGFCSGFVALGVLLRQEGGFFHVLGLIVELPRQDALSRGLQACSKTPFSRQYSIVPSQPSG